MITSRGSYPAAACGITVATGRRVSTSPNRRPAGSCWSVPITRWAGDERRWGAAQLSSRRSSTTWVASASRGLW